MLAIARVSSRLQSDSPPTLVGAGAGRVVVAEAARRLRVKYHDVAQYCQGTEALRAAAAVCAPATALAYLMREVHA
jgi:hypothetical protein